MRVGCNVSSVSPGWSLLPSTVIIVLALVNSTVSPAGTSCISTRPRSAAPLPVSTASTGLLHLLVGAHVHCVRSDTEKYSVWLLPHAHHFQCMTRLYIYICPVLTKCVSSMEILHISLHLLKMNNFPMTLGSNQLYLSRPRSSHHFLLDTCKFLQKDT